MDSHFANVARTTSVLLDNSVDSITGKSFSRVAYEVNSALSGNNSEHDSEHDAEWQRVNSYIADILKDLSVTYSKLARLQSDFVGAELSGLESISTRVLDIGEDMNEFMKGFHDGDAAMVREKTFGHEPVMSPAPAPTPEPTPAPAPQRPEEDFETELDLEGSEDFDEYEDDKEEKPKEESETE
jgi:hypothetical protein